MVALLNRRACFCCLCGTSSIDTLFLAPPDYGPSGTRSYKDIVSALQEVDRIDVGCGGRISSVSTGSSRSTDSEISAASHPRPASCLNLQSAVGIIRRYTPPDFLRAVRESGQFLFRGEGYESNGDVHDQDCPGGCRILRPEPDLLEYSTYDDRDALEYFECMEAEINNGVAFCARPSNGHIGTADRRDAEPWGNVVTVWPLGDEISYVWPKYRKLLYPGGTCDDIKSGLLETDKDLSTALRLGKEILFSTDFKRPKKMKGVEFEKLAAGTSEPTSPFLVVPVEFEEELVKLFHLRTFH